MGDLKNKGFFHKKVFLLITSQRPEQNVCDFLMAHCYYSIIETSDIFINNLSQSFYE